MLAAHLTLGFSSPWGCKSLSPHYISLRAAGISVLFCLASSQSLCLALSLPDSLQGSPYCEGLGEERGGPRPNEDASLMLAFLTAAGGGGCSVPEPLLGSAGMCFRRDQDVVAHLNWEMFLFLLLGWY